MQDPTILDEIALVDDWLDVIETMLYTASLDGADISQDVISQLKSAQDALYRWHEKETPSAEIIQLFRSLDTGLQLKIEPQNSDKKRPKEN